MRARRISSGDGGTMAWAVNVLILAHNRDIRRGGIFHANDMVAGVHMKDFAGDAPCHRRKEKGGALADLLDRYRAPQRGGILVPFENIAEIANAGGRQCLDPP